MPTDDSNPRRLQQQNGFRIANLTERCPHEGPTVFRFVNRRTIATVDGHHLAFVDAAKEFLGGGKSAFEAHGISFQGECLSASQLETFSLAVTAASVALNPRPLIGRYWRSIEIPGVGFAAGVSFWVAFPDLRRSSWALPMAIKLLGLRKPVYVETIDQCAPEIFRPPHPDTQLCSAIDPTLTGADILGLLVVATGKDPRLTAKEWEIVWEFRATAYEIALVMVKAQGLTIETSWRWHPEFNRMVARRRASWLKSL